MLVDGLGTGAALNGGGVSTYVADISNAQEVVTTTSGGLGEVEVGGPTLSIIPRSGGNTTYGAFTLGLNITPPLPSTRFVKGLIIRPEIRYDTSLNNTTPFAAGTASNQFTFAGDVIIKF